MNMEGHQVNSLETSRSISVIKKCAFRASHITALLDADGVQTVYVFIVGGFYIFPAEHFLWCLVMVPKCIAVSVF